MVEMISDSFLLLAKQRGLYSLDGPKSMTLTPLIVLRPGSGIGVPTAGCVGARHASPVWRGPRNVCIWRFGSPDVRATHASPLLSLGARVVTIKDNIEDKLLPIGSDLSLSIAIGYFLLKLVHIGFNHLSRFRSFLHLLNLPPSSQIETAYGLPKTGKTENRGLKKRGIPQEPAG